jgi:hypothetical protein
VRATRKQLGLTHRPPDLQTGDWRFVTDGESSTLVRHAISAVMRGCPLGRQRFLAAPNGLISMSLRTVEIEIAGHIAGLRRSGRRWLGGSGYAAGR